MKQLLLSLCLLSNALFSQNIEKLNNHNLLFGIEVSNKIILPNTENFYNPTVKFNTGSAHEETNSNYSVGLYAAKKIKNYEFGLKGGLMMSQNTFVYQDDRKNISGKNYFYEFSSTSKQKNIYAIPCIKTKIEIEKFILCASFEIPLLFYRGDSLIIKEQYIQYQPGSTLVKEQGVLTTSVWLPKSMAYGLGGSIGLGYKLQKDLHVCFDLSVYYLYNKIEGGLPISLKLAGLATAAGPTPYTYQYYGSAAQLEKQKIVNKGFTAINPTIRLQYAF